MASGKELSKDDLEACKKFHLFYVPGKNLQIVPMVLTPLMKTVMDALIAHRLDVGICSDTLFMLSENRLIKPNESLKAIQKYVKLKKPEHLTGNGLRHQAATFSRLHSSHPQYQDYLASVLGHTLAVHKKHYELSTSVIQKLLVCPILHDIMTGESKEKNKSDIPHKTQKTHTITQTQYQEEESPDFEEKQTISHQLHLPIKCHQIHYYTTS